MKIFILLMSCFLFVLAKYQFPNLPKCQLKDNDCLGKMYEDVVQNMAETGVPELGIPPLDPMALRNVTVSILGLVNITMVKGVATGIKNCVIENFSMNLAEETGYHETTCSLKIEGKYKVNAANSPLIRSFLGSGSIHGEGNGKVSLDKVHITYRWPIYAQRRSNGEIYMYCDFKKTIYDYEVLGGAKFFADNIYLGKEEISKQAIPLLNENWKFVMTTFGKPFIDKAVEIYQDFGAKFFDEVPADNFILDDLTAYAKP